MWAYTFSWRSYSAVLAGAVAAGCRTAQLAYPKNLFLSPDALPFTLAEIWPRLQALALYGSDIFVLDNDQTSSLWGKRSGFDPAGLDYLIERNKGYTTDANETEL